MENLLSIGDHISLVRKNQKLYLAPDEFTEEALTNFLAEDAKAMGLKDVRTFVCSDWYLVTAEANWILNDNRPHVLDYEDAFTHLVSFPQGGPNAISHEIFASAFMKNVFVMNGDKLISIKGIAPNSEIKNEIMNTINTFGLTVGIKGMDKEHIHN